MNGAGGQLNKRKGSAPFSTAFIIRRHVFMISKTSKTIFVGLAALMGFGGLQLLATFIFLRKYFRLCMHALHYRNIFQNERYILERSSKSAALQSKHAMKPEWNIIKCIKLNQRLTLYYNFQWCWIKQKDRGLSDNKF